MPDPVEPGRQALLQGVDRVVDVAAEPVFTMPQRKWDVGDWYADVGKTGRTLGWTPRVGFDALVRMMVEADRA